MFTIPAGTLPAAGVPYTCIVTGTYTVTFGGGVGAGLVIATGDTEVCIVDPAPDDVTLPRLSMRRLDLGDGGFRTCRRGDQVFNYYLIENNDPAESVTFMFESTTNQVSKMPTGDNTDNTFFAISDPSAGTDNFPLAFADDLDGDSPAIALPNPLEVSDRMISRSFTVEPNQLLVVCTAVRSFGMCADGSCSEVNAKITGEFADGTQALACASTAVVVQGTDPKSPFCSVTDVLKTGVAVDTRWSRAVFDDAGFLTTHFAGNLFPDEAGPGTVTAGPELNSPWPQNLSDFLTVDALPTRVAFTADSFSAATGFQLQRMQVEIVNLNLESSVAVPLIRTDLK